MKQNKRKKNKGFTLVETVASLIAVTLVTAIFLTLTAFSKDSYVAMETSSEGQVLASILTNAIQDELRYASNVDKIDTETKSDIKLYSNESTSYVGYHFTYYSNSLGLGPDCMIKNETVTDSETGKLHYEIFVYPDSTNIQTKLSNGKKVERQSITGTSSYVYNLSAVVDAYYIPTQKCFYVSLCVIDEDYNLQTVQAALDAHNLSSLTSTIINTNFIVQPLNKNALY